MAKFDEYLLKLTPREEKIVKMFLERKTAKEIKEHFGLTYLRLSQILSKALRKLAFQINKA